MDSDLISPLLALPAEVRDRIYDFVLEGRYEFQEGTIYVTVQYGDPVDESITDKLPNTLLTCKQLLEEGSLQFYRHAVCTSLARRSARSYKTASPKQGLFQIHRLRKINLHDSPNTLLFSNRWEDRQVPGELRLQVNSHSEYKLRVFAAYLRLRENHLKDLTIKFSLRLEQSLRILHLDLSFLQGFARLERVEFIIEEPELDAGEDQLSEYDFLHRQVQLELLKVASSLVSGGDGQGAVPSGTCIMKDWIEEEQFEELTKDGSTYWFVDHSWHLECRRGTKSAGANSLAVEGLHCWLAMAEEQSGEMRHFRRLTDTAAGNDELAWHCALTNETIIVPTPSCVRI